MVNVLRMSLGELCRTRMLAILCLVVALPFLSIHVFGPLSVTAQYINTAKYNKLHHAIRPIRIALAVDDHSQKDVLLLMNSAVEAALEPESLVFHIVAVGKDNIDSTLLRHSIETSIRNCLPDTAAEVVSFVLPRTSGFAAQLANAKKKHHWTSQAGADMTRFFLPQIFPHVERLLYLDNDIIVSCCLETIWDTDLGKDKIVGIVLDDLKWATQTQYKYHYNASHPLVVKNMMRGQLEGGERKDGTEMELPHIFPSDAFARALPRYPNDGVLLIDVPRYTSSRILELLEEIATANSRGDWVVNLGTQQFTVLALWDRWVELTPRANLRHFPDMARGYMMWFYYNGFIHYAGQAKPRNLCLQGNYKDNFLRVGSYTPWVTSNKQLSVKCPMDKLVYTESCVEHIVSPRRLEDFLVLLRKIILANQDENNLYVRIGAIRGSMTKEAFDTINLPIMQSANESVTTNTTDIFYRTLDAQYAKSSQDITHNRMHIGFDMLEFIDRQILFGADWSHRIFLKNEKQLSETEKTGKTEKSSSISGTERGNGNTNGENWFLRTPVTGKKVGKKYSFLVSDKRLCESLYMHLPSKPGVAISTALRSSGNSMQASSASPIAPAQGIQDNTLSQVTDSLRSTENAKEVGNNTYASVIGSIQQPKEQQRHEHRAATPSQHADKKWVLTAGSGGLRLDPLGNPLPREVISAAIANKETDQASETESSGSAGGGRQVCTTVLEEVREEKKKHWDVAMITIDTLSPAEMVRENEKLAILYAEYNENMNSSHSGVKHGAGGGEYYDSNKGTAVTNAISMEESKLFATMELFGKAEAAEVTNMRKTLNRRTPRSQEHQQHGKREQDTETGRKGMEPQSNPPSPRLPENTSGGGGRHVPSPWTSYRRRTLRSSAFGALLNLELEFLRPRAIFVRLYNYHSIIQHEVKDALHFLTRHGFQSFVDTSGYCSSSMSTPGSNKRVNASTADLLVYSCVWGTRINAFEMIDVL